MVTREEQYHQAAITYLVYGLTYLSGALYLAVNDMVARSGWVWFAVGAVIIVVLPPLIWFQYKWVTRVLALLVAFRVVGLGRTIITNDKTPIPMPWGGDLPMRYGALVFLLIAAVTSVMLARAGWGWGRDEES